MIQRIQSIYLLLAAAALGGQFALPYATAPANSPATAQAALADGVLNPLDNVGLLGLSVLGIALAVAAIFLFKNRPFQGKLAGLGAVVSVLLMVLAGFVFYNIQKEIPAGSPVSYNLGFVLPVLALGFNWLAAGAIRRDDNLVRSADRLR